MEPEIQTALDHQHAQRYPQAEEIYRRVLAGNPDHGDALHFLGVLLFATGRAEEAEKLIRRSIELQPDFPQAHNNLGNILVLDGRFDEAIACYRKSLTIRPQYSEALNNLGMALRQAHRLDESAETFRKSIAIAPDFAGAHHNLGMVLIQMGKYREGWREHEWRLRRPDHASPMRNSAKPQWGGSDLFGRTILLNSEQGLGDTIQFSRYMVVILKRAGKIVLECPPELYRLFLSNTVPHETTVITQSARQTSPPAFDVYSPLMSLPLALGIEDPALSPQRYLVAHAGLVEQWKTHLPERKGLRVGLAWTGNPRHQNHRFRSMPFAALAPLKQIPGVQFFSLQVDGGADIAAGGMEVIDLTGKIGDFADTAALIKHLDLVVSVDTAVAHLSAALGTPTWLMLPFTSDFRWGVDTETTPWYRSMRLFRQKTLGKWDDVIARVADELARFKPEPV